MQRAKTQRRRVPLTPASDVLGPFQGDNVVKATEDSLEALFSAETTSTFQQPWQKLDRGARLDRLRKFVQTYTPAEGTLTPAERASLLTAVLRAYELRQLNTKAAVEYDPVSATIISIRGLRDRLMPTGLRTFRIEQPAAPVPRATQRRVKTADRLSTTATATAAGGGLNIPTIEHTNE
jgi:hypothetical protein